MKAESCWLFAGVLPGLLAITLAGCGQSHPLQPGFPQGDSNSKISNLEISGPETKVGKRRKTAQAPMGQVVDNAALAPEAAVPWEEHAEEAGLPRQTAEMPEPPPRKLSPPPRRGEKKPPSNRRSHFPQAGVRQAGVRQAGVRQAGVRQQAGVLTAGSIDDHQNYEGFWDFRRKLRHSHLGQYLPRFDLRQRVVITVETSEGRPVGDARVIVRRGANQRVGGPGEPYGRISDAVLDIRTGSDGRAVLWTGLDIPQAHPHEVLTLTVFPPPGVKSSPVTIPAARASDGHWLVTLRSYDRPRLPGGLDLALVIDTTSSMNDELEYLQAEFASVSRSIHRQFPDVDQRYALIVFRDEGDEYVTHTNDFTPSLPEFQAFLSGQYADAGGDPPEAFHRAMAELEQLSWREGIGTARLAFLVTDAPPHRADGATVLRSANNLRRSGVTVFPIAASGAKEEAEHILRAIALLTMGQYLFLTDHSGVGHSHATPSAAYFHVERLDRLMTRLIASELAGQSLPPNHFVDTSGQGPQSQVVGHTCAYQSRTPRQQPAAVAHQQRPTPTPPRSLHGQNPSGQYADQAPGWVLFAVPVLAAVGIAIVQGLLKR